MKRKNTRAIIAVVVAIALIFGALFAYEYIEKSDLAARAAELETQITNNTKAVYVATRDIMPGEQLVAEGSSANVEIQNIASGISDDAYILDEQIGQVAKVEIMSGYPIYANMVTEKYITPDVRETELVETLPMTTQKDYDVVDVRIAFPDGEDYLVLTNKTVRDLNLVSCVFTIQMSEEEILRYQSACVDAYLTKGLLYTTRYVEPSLQNEEEMVPDYLVRSSTVDLISEVDTNTKYDTVVANTLNKKARRELATRLGLSIEDEKLDKDGNSDRTLVEDGLQEKEDIVKNALEFRSQTLGEEVEETPAETAAQAAEETE